MAGFGAAWVPRLGRQLLLGLDHEAGDEDGSKDENEVGGGQSGLEHAHDELSWVLRGTQYGNNRRRKVAFLATPICSVDNLNAG